MEASSSLSKIAKNTTFLYIRMIVLMIINLYTVRVVINALGADDYGLFNLVAGVITMLTCVTNVLSSATQRFYSFHLGDGNQEKYKNVYRCSLLISLIIAGCVILLGETIGLWFVDNKLIIPEDRLNAAHWIYQFSILTFITSLLQMPYSAAVIAHEDIGAYSIITTSEYVLKLLFAFLVRYSSVDRLILYGFLQFIAHFLLLLGYYLFTTKKYKVLFSPISRKINMFQEMVSYSGWTLYGAVAGIGMNQVNTILLNIFFGPSVNAARAISIQVYSAINALSNNFLAAIKSPMIKSYASQEYGILNNIFSLSNKFIFYCMIMVGIPLFVEMDTVLQIWLNVHDPLTVSFSRYMVIYTIVLSLNNPISIIIQAAGYVKQYHLATEVLTLLCPIFTYVSFKMGFPAISTFFLMVVAITGSHIVRLICLKKYYNEFSITHYIQSFILPGILVVLICAISQHFLINHLSSGFIRLFISIVLSILETLLLGFVIGLSKEERNIIIKYIYKLKKA